MRFICTAPIAGGTPQCWLDNFKERGCTGPNSLTGALLLDQKTTMAARKVACSVIGFGLPKRSMGWYHAEHLIDGKVPNAVLTDVVEPHFLHPATKTSDPAGAGAFESFMQAQSSNIGFHADVRSSTPAGRDSLAIISARTADCPALFEQAVEHKFKHIFLEKPVS